MINMEVNGLSWCRIGKEDCHGQIEVVRGGAMFVIWFHVENQWCENQ